MSARRLRQVLLLLTLLAYALLEQYSNGRHAPRALGALLAIAPLLVALGLLATRTVRPAWALATLLVLTGLLLPPLWPRLERHYAEVYLLQQCGVYLMLASFFGRTLLPGYTPLCTQWALRVHGSIDERVRRYTRSVTLVWTMFFVVLVIMSVTLFAAVAHSTWSLFGNLVTLPLAALLFAVEYRLRRRWLPFMPQASLAQMLTAYAADPRGTRSH